MFCRFFLPIYIVAYMVILYVVNVRSFKKKYDFDPRVITKNDKLMYFYQRCRDLTFLFILANIFFYSFLHELYYLFVPIKYLDVEILKLAGIFILLGSGVLTRVSQIQLKGSYRIGIDKSETKTDLVTDGIYSRSRNPIVLGMILSSLGLFLVTPNLITFVILVLAYVNCTARIILEEEHLYKLHGEAYLSYQKKTRRWF
ncbi:hypothetical protein FEDK69T_18960 [Flavobacterium enshiense DK69]|nr:hypothetical protein FEDK69T_18960 [Flavobacterium enshiense DK69]